MRRPDRSSPVVAAALVLLLLAGCRSEPPRPNILLITLDTTRADRLTCYGYPQPTSPNIDRLAAESILYTRALSTSSWTLPAHASLFTGKFPKSHGARYDPDGPLLLNAVLADGDDYEEHRARGLHPAEPTLAQLLQAEGYSTAAVVGGPWLKAVFGLARGFDHYDDDELDSINGRRAEQVTDRALAWIERHLDQRQFVFLNYFDPHVPYDPPKEFARPFVPIRRTGTEQELNSVRYNGEVAYMDHHLGRLLDRLRELGLYERTLIIVTGDHGELLGDGGRYGHGISLSEQELHVPLLIKYPGATPPAGRETTRVQLIDILPMIADHLRLDLPEGVQGASGGEQAHAILAEVRPLSHQSDAGDWRSLHQGDLKFLWNSRGAHQLYRVDDDPFERNNLLDEAAAEAARLETELERAFAALPAAPPLPEGGGMEIDAETREALESLGYLK